MRPRRRRLWQQNSPIAPYSGSSDDESPSDHSDADESSYSQGSVGSNFIPASLISQQDTNITDPPSPVEEDTIIERIESPVEEGTIFGSLENPQQDTIIESIENPQQDTIIKPEIPQLENTISKPENPQRESAITNSERPQQEDAIIKSEVPHQEDAIIKLEGLLEEVIIKSESPLGGGNITKPESPQQEDTIIKSEDLETSAVLKSLPLYATSIQPEESISPSPPHLIKSESQIDDDIIMADAALPHRAEPLSDASSHTIGHDSPPPDSLTSTEILSSDDEVTDRCYGFLLLHYPESLPESVDTISVLLVCQLRPHGLPPYWSFPKGHPEPEDCSNWESATRELFEETGLAPERVEPITSSDFSPPLPDLVDRLRPDYMSIISRYPSSNGGIKEVTYFLARVAELEKLTAQVEELVECRWVTLTEARDLADTTHVRKVLAKLIGLVYSGPESVVAETDSIRWKEVDALDENGIPRQWRYVEFCTQK
ncbi:hypothetical protein VE03_08596 [Pseudogymnoascus sp. 23342-1-I1]|nr:hypothetical protein VE03_08596 [Pseudogymnoascus sp. 23342-1-I1]